VDDQLHVRAVLSSVPTEVRGWVGTAPERTLRKTSVHVGNGTPDSAARSQTRGIGGRHFFCSIVQASPLAELTQRLTNTSKKALCLDNQTKAPFAIQRQ